jgi:hypothetical protein
MLSGLTKVGLAAFGPDPANITAWATIVLAGVAAAALIANVIALRVSNKAVAAATRAAEATEKAAASAETSVDAAVREAKASEAVIEEMRIDRELAWRPYLSTQLNLSYQPTPEQPEMHNLTNHGRGPAINCRLAIRVGGSWKLNSGHIVTLAPSQTAEVVVQHQATATPPDIFPELARGSAAPDRVVVLMCEDQFGNQLIFRPPEAGGEIWRPGRDKGEDALWARWMRITRPTPWV